MTCYSGVMWYTVMWCGSESYGSEVLCTVMWCDIVQWKTAMWYMIFRDTLCSAEAGRHTPVFIILFTGSWTSPNLLWPVPSFLFTQKLSLLQSFLNHSSPYVWSDVVNSFVLLLILVLFLHVFSSLEGVMILIVIVIYMYHRTVMPNGNYHPNCPPGLWYNLY